MYETIKHWLNQQTFSGLIKLAFNIPYFFLPKDFKHQMRVILEVIEKDLIK